MKTLLLRCTLFGALAAAFTQGSPEKNPKNGLVSVGCYVSDVAGTTLRREDTHTEGIEEGWTKDDCRIGYEQSSSDGKSTKFVPVLKLPVLKNDHYVVACREGVLTVTTAKDKSLVVALNLMNLAPGLVTQIPAEQAADGKTPEASKPPH
jgi:hypothetical protein